MPPASLAAPFVRSGAISAFSRMAASRSTTNATAAAASGRSIDPYHLTFVTGGLYLVGYCHLRREVRIFAVERIRAVTALRDTFQVPAGFDAEAYLREAWGIVRGDLVSVQAVFSRAGAPHVRDRLWHPSQQLRELPEGRLELRVTVADTLEVRRWLLGFGAEVEVLAPPSLREAIRREADKLALMLADGRKPLARATADEARPVGGARATKPSRRTRG